MVLETSGDSKYNYSSRFWEKPMSTRLSFGKVGGLPDMSIEFGYSDAEELDSRILSIPNCRRARRSASVN